MLNHPVEVMGNNGAASFLPGAVLPESVCFAWLLALSLRSLALTIVYKARPEAATIAPMTLSLVRGLACHRTPKAAIASWRRFSSPPTARQGAITGVAD